MNQYHYNINFDNIKEIAHAGIRRDNVFIRYGVNAARNKDIQEIRLGAYGGIDIIPPDKAVKNLNEIKKEFESWIIINGIGELIITFSYFLDNLNHTLLLCQLFKNLISNDELEQLDKNFKKIGLIKKLKILSNTYDIETIWTPYIASTYSIRNCLTHRNGIVQKSDLNSNGVLQLEWWSFNFVGLKPDGTPIPITPPISEKGIHLDAGTRITVEPTTRERVFKEGEKITLTPKELSEICFLFGQGTEDFINQALKYLKKIEIEPNINHQY